MCVCVLVCAFVQACCRAALGTHAPLLWPLSGRAASKQQLPLLPIPSCVGLRHVCPRCSLVAAVHDHRNCRPLCARFCLPSWAMASCTLSPNPYISHLLRYLQAACHLALGPVTGCVFPHMACPQADWASGNLKEDHDEVMCALCCVVLASQTAVNPPWPDRPLFQLGRIRIGTILCLGTAFMCHQELRPVFNCHCAPPTLQLLCPSNGRCSLYVMKQDCVSTCDDTCGAGTWVVIVHRCVAGSGCHVWLESGSVRQAGGRVCG